MIATVTFNPAVDQTMQFDQKISRNIINRSIESRFDASGKGINVSRFLSSVGIKTKAIGLVGGFTGEFIRSDLSNEGIPHFFVTIRGPTRINTTVISKSGSFKFNQTGPYIDKPVADTIISKLKETDPDLVHIGGSLPPGIDTDVIDAIASGPWNTSVDVHGDLLPDLNARYSICKPNRIELEGATGLKLSTIEDYRQAARQVQKWGFNKVIVSLGDDGAIAVGDNQTFVADALDVKVVDEVGAGDALIAGVLGGINQGESLQFSLRSGVALASNIIENKGSPVLNDSWPPEKIEKVSIRQK